MKTFNLRIFNFATGAFDLGNIIVPRRYQCGYVYSRRSGCFLVVHNRKEIRVNPALFRKMTGKAAHDLAGHAAFTADELRLMGFDTITA
ncbi:hypothetical protein [Paenibacillus sp. OAS669]|uniref:hypothetical protein n=1 Tax=Paenibacillus sp. OAS669 TaxID=2663821 RepID=UPI0017896713|nr:hypothetical protein [Paenibacillus sp. OAS669]MBE1443900.1 hypothetical protein [Paenibacillus sp. OAS669]